MRATSAEQENETVDQSFDGQRVVRSALLMILDIAFIALAYFLALILRFDFDLDLVEPQYIEGFRTIIIPYIVADIIILWIFRLYHSIWTFASTSELLHLVYAWIVAQVPVLVIYIITQIRMPISFWVVGALFGFLFTAALRFGYRFVRLLRARLRANGANGEKTERVMIVGAGVAGRDLIREIKYSDKLGWKVVCAIDDNSFKVGKFLDGVPIVGNRSMISAAVRDYSVTQILFAIPTAGGPTRRDILEICQRTGCKILAMPGIYQLLDGQVSVSRLREVQIDDLLGRDPIVINNEEVNEFIRDKTVLVTGGGGSIGSELCRQIAKDQPRQLIILDIYENNAYEIQQELLRTHPALNLETLVGSVRNTSRVEWIFEHYKPQVVFHAAAHKHVPLMEKSPNEAIKNNVMGTYKVAKAALEYGADRFVLISTDKAVNPTNIMGASKRVCEMIVQMMARRAESEQAEKHTVFSAVRFGNVLGSNGSVIPLFQKQIAEGGPVTVTDKNIIRYFMTIPEAVSLVLQASYYAQGGEIFVLNMGDPVKIDDMARKLIRLSGYEPDVDIKIVYTGLRPGEKLFEEMLMDEEGLKDTPNKLIYIGSPIEMDDAVVSEQIRELDEASLNESGRIKQLMARIVPTYKPDLHSEDAAVSAGIASANNATADHPAGIIPQEGE